MMTTAAKHVDDEPIRIFVGTDQTQLVPALVLTHSLCRSWAVQRLEIFFLQAGSGRLLQYQDRDLADLKALPLLPSERPARSGTQFSVARFTIPELCDWRGKALYFDADQFCMADVQDLWDVPLGERSLAACRSRRPGSPSNSYDTSVMLLRCDRCPWNIRQVLDGLASGLWDYWEVMCASGRACWLCESGALELDSAWNAFDVPTESTKLLHYTTREHQPWRNDALPSARSRDIWEQGLREASRNVPILCQLVRDGVGAGFLKPRLLSLIDDLKCDAPDLLTG